MDHDGPLMMNERNDVTFVEIAEAGKVELDSGMDET
jgi:hypothetical protein